MCTIIVLNQHHKEFPLIIGANRDEDRARKSSPVQILSRDPHFIIGGKDEPSGGTWMGVNKYSIFAGITNQWETLSNKESRGQLVLDVLKQKSVNDILYLLENLDINKYNHFNLVFGTPNNVYLAHSYMLDSVVVHEIPKGVSIITNNMSFSPTDKKNQYIHKALNSQIDLPWIKYYSLLKSILRNKTVYSKGDNYVTKSSSVLAFSPTNLERYKFLDRSDKIKKYNDYIDLFRSEK